MLVVDTCQAKNIEGRFDANSLVKHSASSLFAFVLARQKGSEGSQEYPSGKYGLFTYALLEGLKGKADHNHDGLVSVNELFEFTAPLVEKLRDRSMGPQTPQFIAPESLNSFPLIGGYPSLAERVGVWNEFSVSEGKRALFSVRVSG